MEPHLDDSVGSSFLTEFTIPEFLTYALEQTTNVPEAFKDIYTVHKSSTEGKKHFNYIYYIGEYLLKTWAKQDNDRVDLKVKLQEFKRQLGTLQDELKKKKEIEAKKGGSDIRLEIQQIESDIADIQLIINTHSYIPSFINPCDHTRYENFQKEIIEDLIQSATTQAAKLYSDDEYARKQRPVTERRLQHVVNATLNYVESPDVLIHIAKTISTTQPNNNYRTDFLDSLLLGVVEKLKQRVEEIKKWNIEKETIRGQLEILKQESTELAKIKQTLPPALQAKKEQLEQEMKTNYNVIRHYDCGTIESYDQWLFEAANIVLNKALSPQRGTESSITEAVNWCLETLTNPNHLLQLAQSLQSSKQFMKVQSVGYRVQALISEAGEKEAAFVQMDARLAKLEDDQQKEYVQWKVLPEDQLNELRSLKLQLGYLKALKPAHYLFSYKQRGDCLLQVSKIMVHSLLDHFAAEKIDRHTTTQRLDTILDEMVDPVHLSELMKVLLSRNETEYVLKFGEKCQERIKDIETQREIRLPLVKQINDLEKIQADLATKNKKLSPQQQKALEEAHNKLDSLPSWPAYADLKNVHQYDELNLDVVRGMTTAILEDKVQLNKRIEKLYQENDPSTINAAEIQAQRNEIANKINNLVTMTLLKFPDPKYLLRFAEDMGNSSEDEIVFRVGEKCFEKIAEYEQALKERIPILRRVEQLTAKKEEKKTSFPKAKAEALAKLQSDLEALLPLPHFVSNDINQYNATKLNMAQLILKTTSSSQRTLEKKLEEASYTRDPRLRKEYSQIKEERKKQNNKINHLVELFERFITSPHHYQELIRSAAKNLTVKEPANFFYPSFVLLLTKAAYPLLEKEAERAQEFDRLVQYADLLRKEKKELDQFKKELPAEVKSVLKECSQKLKKISLSEDKPLSSPEIESIRCEITKTSSEHLFSLKSAFTSAYDKNDDYYKHLAEKADLMSNQENSLLAWVLQFEVNPNLLTALVSLLGTPSIDRPQEFAAALHLGKHTKDLISSLRDKRNAYNEHMQRKDEITKEKEELDKQRKVLSTAKHQELRELQLESLLFEAQPSYKRYPSDIYDNLFIELIVALVSTFNTKIKRLEDSAAMDDSVSESELSQQKHVITEESIELLRSFFDHLHDVQSYISLAQKIENKNTYRHIIAIAVRGEDLVERLRAQLDERSELELAHKTAEQRLIAAKIFAAEAVKDEAAVTTRGKRRAPQTSIVSLEEEVKEAAQRLKEVPPIKCDYDELNKLLLQLAELAIKAAKVEDMDDILLEQTIIAFKAETSTERWDAVKNLCTESNWSDIKRELVVYVLKREDNARAKIELLLKDGLYKECINIFPPPTAEDDSELDSLLKFFNLVEKDEPELLPDVVSIVQRYLKRYFQAFKFTQMNPLLDKVQRHYPGLLKAMYAKATDMILLNILPSQYPAFVKCLKELKRRLVDECSKPEEWDNFLLEFKKRHQGKKRLIQMVSLIGDSCWDLQAVIDQSEGGRPSSPKRRKGKY